MEPVCKLCSRGPAQVFTFRRHVGMLILQKFYKVEAPLCREHALALGKQYLSKTLVLGWWGVTSLFFNFGAVFTDLTGLRRAKEMPLPTASIGRPDLPAPPAMAPPPSPIS